MPEYLSPGVFVKEVPSRLRTITGVSTSTAAFIGETEKGPLDQARLVTSYSQFETQYGRPLTGYYLALSVQLFFANGGTRLYIARVNNKAKSLSDETHYQQAFDLLNDVEDMSLIAIPGVGTTSMIEFATNYCRKREDCFFIADLPQTTDTVTDAQQAIKAIRNKSSYAALYFPWLQLKDAKTHSLVPVPPSGAVAGVYARIDSTRGVWKAPAGTQATVKNVSGVALPVSDKEQELLNPVGVNVVRDFPTLGIAVWGSGTLTKSDPEFGYVPVRRTAIYIEESIKQGIQWAVFEPNDTNLWGQLNLLISTFMQGLFRDGAFQGSSAKEAFFVKCDSETTTQNDILNGVVNIQIGFAPLKPAEFVIIRIQQKTGQTNN